MFPPSVTNTANIQGYCKGVGPIELSNYNRYVDLRDGIQTMRTAKYNNRALDDPNLEIE